MRYVYLISAGLILGGCAADPIITDTRGMTPEQRSQYEADMIECVQKQKTSFISEGAPNCLRAKGYKLISG